MSTKTNAERQQEWQLRKRKEGKQQLTVYIDSTYIRRLDDILKQLEQELQSDAGYRKREQIALTDKPTTKTGMKAYRRKLKQIEKDYTIKLNRADVIEHIFESYAY